MYKLLAYIILLIFHVPAKAQKNDSSINLLASRSTTTNLPKPEILTNGFIDVVNNGQLNASARFLRLYIGEPGKLAIPISIYSGVSSSSLQNQAAFSSIINRNNDQLYNNFINPLSGLANISIDGIGFLKKQKNKLTKTGIMYHMGEKVLTGYRSGPITNPQTGRPVNF